jgi:hypothetical protein
LFWLSSGLKNEIVSRYGLASHWIPLGEKSGKIIFEAIGINSLKISIFVKK